MITASGVTKVYRGRAVVSDVDVRFPAQRLTSLIGPNGAGKSTLLMMIARLLEPTAGDIRIDGHDIRAMKRREFAMRVATLRQSPESGLRLTVDELVAFGRFPYGGGTPTPADRHAIDEAIAFLSLEPLRSAYIDELSGGQRRMAFLAMTIAQQTDCLLLDEPLGNLDIRHAVRIMRALRRLCDEHGRTVVLVVHDINFAANHSDHIVAMKDGRIHCAGLVHEVVTEPRMTDLYGLPFRITRSGRGLLCNYFDPPGDPT